MKKTVLSLTFLFLSSTFAMASDYVPCAEGEEGSCWPCGDTCTARISYDNEEDKANQRNATITYSGYGTMYNYRSPYNNPELIDVEPWYDMSSRITKAVVEDGITRVGARSIYYMNNLSEIELPNSLLSIGSYAFHGSSVPQIVIPENTSSIAMDAFGDSGHTNILICPENIQTQCSSVSARTTTNIGIKTYQKSGDQFFYDNKWYNSLGDIQSGNYAKKRIYTVGEANSVTGKKNSIKIRYK